jgi:hypothetical protein
MTPKILTRHDKATGQPAYDYYLAIRWDDPRGRFLRPQPEGGFRRYDLVEVIVRRHQII